MCDSKHLVVENGKWMDDSQRMTRRADTALKKINMMKVERQSKSVAVVFNGLDWGGMLADGKIGKGRFEGRRVDRGGNVKKKQKDVAWVIGKVNENSQEIMKRNPHEIVIESNRQVVDEIINPVIQQNTNQFITNVKDTPNIINKQHLTSKSTTSAMQTFTNNLILSRQTHKTLSVRKQYKQICQQLKFQSQNFMQYPLVQYRSIYIPSLVNATRKTSQTRSYKSMECRSVTKPQSVQQCRRSLHNRLVQPSKRVFIGGRNLEQAAEQYDRNFKEMAKKVEQFELRQSQEKQKEKGKRKIERFWQNNGYSSSLAHKMEKTVLIRRKRKVYEQGKEKVNQGQINPWDVVDYQYL